MPRIKDIVNQAESNSRDYTIFGVWILGQARFLAVAGEAVTHLKRLQELYPHLVSPYVDAAVENWGKHFADIEARKAVAELRQAEGESLSRLAYELIENYQMEDVLQMLSEEFSIDVDYDRLIGLVGKERYTSALRREFDEMVANSISVELIADLWNGMGKPALGGQRWTAETFSATLRLPGLDDSWLQDGPLLSGTVHETAGRQEN